MDNLTHSLVGALIGQAGFKRKTGLAMPALIIGANLPDIDATCTLYGIESLAMRRGLTHGPIAWFLLPLLLAAILWMYDRRQDKRGKRPATRLPVRFGWLFLLAFVACLTHPALDYLNNYGIRLLEPFSHRWFYGDTLFIVDVWLWLLMGLATWFSLRQEKQGKNWRAPALIAMVVALTYIGGNFAYSRSFIGSADGALVIPNPYPVEFWKRDRIVRVGDGLWWIDGPEPGNIDLQKRGDRPLGGCDLAAASRADPRVKAFLFWSRAPFLNYDGDVWVLSDARFAWGRWPARNGFSVELPAGTCAR